MERKKNRRASLRKRVEENGEQKRKRDEKAGSWRRKERASIEDGVEESGRQKASRRV